METEMSCPHHPLRKILLPLQSIPSKFRLPQRGLHPKTYYSAGTEA